MSTAKITIVVAVLAGLVGLLACKANDRDDQVGSVAKAAAATLTSGEWHELRVEAIGDKITCYYDEGKKIEATDGTFKDAGKVGLWTKADSVTSFDDLKVTAK